MTADLRSITAESIKRLLRAMAGQVDDADLKHCILTARAHGHLSDDETDFYISACGLANA